MNLDNKWIRAAIPALLMHCSIGTVYCWSTFKETIANEIRVNTFALGWAFSLAIFFLGMSAAFAGRLVEKNIHKSSLISCICFSIGMIGTGLSIKFLKGVPALLMIYLFYGCIMGIGLGIGYLTPVKTLMLWFKDNKGLATGISIMGFGLAKAIATPIMELLQNRVGISAMFYILGFIYFILMFIGHKLLQKPKNWKEEQEQKEKINMFKNKTFILIWLMFFINIHCGLALITYEKQILNYVNAGVILLALIPSITALLNAAGRLGYSTASDRMKDRNTVYKIIFKTCALATAISIGNFSVIWIILLLGIVNLGYGGGFSTLPALLSSRFGMKNISKIHGLALSAWAAAGITGNNMSALILNFSNNNYKIILYFTLALYSIAYVISINIKNTKEEC